MLGKTWLSEISEESGSAFSVKIQEKLDSETSNYQTIDIYASEEYGNIMVIDGFIKVTERDNDIYHEMLVHPAMFTHANPETVAIIGGGYCGSLRQVLKHENVKNATLIEIDEQVTLLSRKYFPITGQAANDQRAKVRHQNGLKWIKENDGNDVIIVDSTDPTGHNPEMFTESFYRDCFDSLNDGGILVQQSESPLFHMNILKPMRETMMAAGFSSVCTLNFFISSYPSGWWTCTMAAKDDSVDFNTINEAAIANKTFDTFYYNAEMHRAAMAMPEFVKRELMN